MATLPGLLDEALAAHHAGLAVLPPRQDGTKAPDGQWKAAQSTRPDEATIRAWYANGRTGIGIVCGKISGNLEVLELDHGGTDPATGSPRTQAEQWKLFAQRCDDGGLAALLERVVTGYVERTPGGGVHLFYRSTEPVDGNTKLARRPAVDAELTDAERALIADPAMSQTKASDFVRVILETRGEGGYIVAAPSHGAVHASGLAYERLRGDWSSIVTVTAAERWALHQVALSFDEMPALEPAPPAPRPATSSSATSGSWMDQTIAAFDQATTWPQILEPHGWQHAGRQGHVDCWTRPGKPVKDGHSATVNANGTDRLILWSSSVAIPGVETARGGGHAPSYDRFSVWAGYEHHGDRQAAAVAARKNGHGPEWTEHDTSGARLLEQVQRDRGTGEDSNPQSAAPSPATNLPAAFWDARPILTHIRDAAWSRTASPDAVFAAVMARHAAYSSFQYEIPPVVGTPTGLNYFVAVVAPSGTGKSIATAISGELIAPPITLDVADDLPLGSGEGLAEAYMGEKEEETEGGKTKMVRQQVRHNAFVTVDEGAAISAMMERSGATVLEALRRAWSGSTLGQANASADRKRIIKASLYRLGLVVAFQPELAGKLLGDVHAGTPQRFLFATAIDPHIPDHAPDWPGTIHVPDIPVPDVEAHSIAGRGGYRRIRFGIDAGLAASIRATHLAKSRGQLEVAELDSQEPVHRLKIAALLALLDGRLDIDLEDWALADIVWSTSCAVRDHVVAAVAAAAARDEEAAVARRARGEVVIEAARRSAPVKVEQLAARLARWVHEQTAAGQLEGGATRGALNRRMKAPERLLGDSALAHAVELLMLEETAEGLYVPGSTRPA